MKLDVLDIKGKSVEKLDFNEKHFEVTPNMTMLSQYIRVFQTNQRQGTVKTKTRAEVSGGGKKPWKQKGTGRARHGSSRSPIWAKGGVAHGPKPRDWNLTFPRSFSNKTLVMALALKHKGNYLTLMENFDVKAPKTAFFADIVKHLNLKGKTLVVLNKKNVNLIKSAANIKNLKVALNDNINTFDILTSKNVLFEKDAFLAVQKRFK